MSDSLEITPQSETASHSRASSQVETDSQSEITAQSSATSQSETDSQPDNLVTHIHLQYWAPPCVVQSLWGGSTCYVGFLAGKRTVLKYPFDLDSSRELIPVEVAMYERLGFHPHVLRFHGRNEHGLILDYASNGTLDRYLKENPLTTTKQRATWCRELAEAVVHVHSRHVLHCNISAVNAFLDDDLSLKLGDFQGILMDPLDGSVLISGHVTEPAKWCLPRVDYDREDYASVKSDIFAIGSTIHEIMTGSEPFPDLDVFVEDELVEARFRAGGFPELNDIAGGDIIRKCWVEQYETADELLADLVLLEEQCQ